MTVWVPFVYSRDMSTYTIISQSPAGRTFTSEAESNYADVANHYAELVEFYPEHIHVVYENNSDGTQREMLRNV